MIGSVAVKIKLSDNNLSSVTVLAKHSEQEESGREQCLCSEHVLKQSRKRKMGISVYRRFE